MYCNYPDDNDDEPKKRKKSFKCWILYALNYTYNVGFRRLADVGTRGNFRGKDRNLQM